MIYRISKWTKYTLMRGSNKLRPHVPITKRFTENAFWNLLANYGDVILKPVDGCRGFGVFRVTRVGYDSYQIHHERNRLSINGAERLYGYLQRKFKSRSYIVQRRIPLATINGRPFDMRVIVQRKSLSAPWQVTGKVAKVAGKGYIVTNITRSKGNVLPIKTALRRSSLQGHSPRILLSSIDKVALQSTEELGKSKLYSYKTIFGYDMGFDQNGHIWIIEVNLDPMISHFYALKNKTMYYRILRY